MWFLFLTGFNNPQVCNFLSFLFTFAFFIGYTSKEAKFKKSMIHVPALFWPQPILLMLAAPSSKFYPKLHISEPAQRFIDSSCIFHYLGAHHNIVFQSHAHLCCDFSTNLRFYFYLCFRYSFSSPLLSTAFC